MTSTKTVEEEIAAGRYATAMKLAKKAIDAQGRCELCGDKYAAHRTVEAQMDRAIGGEGFDAIAADYGISEEGMVLRWEALMFLYAAASLTTGSEQA